jgi:hypothetical protein
VAAIGLLLQPIFAGDEKKSKESAKKKDPVVKPIVVDGELINADIKDKVFTQSYCKTYTFKMEKGKLYHVELNSPAFPAMLRLEDTGGSQVDAESARFGSANVFHRPAKTGDYTIIATCQNAALGKFTLTIKELTGDDGKPIELKSDKGKADFAGNLLKLDPVYKGGKKHKMFHFTMEAGKTYQIDMTSKAFDSYLFLESPEGKLLAQDDDGGGYPNARITFKAAEAGKHRIITSYFGGAGSGPFNLSVRQTD